MRNADAQNTGIEHVVLGPTIYTTAFDEEVVGGAQPLVVVAQNQYAIVRNPAKVDESGVPRTDAHGVIQLRHGAAEVRLGVTTFPLYPGETLAQPPTPLLFVPKAEALLLRARWDAGERRAGETFLFNGPGTYVPNVSSIWRVWRLCVCLLSARFSF